MTAVLVGVFIGFAMTIIGMAGGIAYSITEYAKEQRRQRRPDPVCGCKHHASFHDTRGCHYVADDSYHRECGCVKYIGPEVPELT